MYVCIYIHICIYIQIKKTVRSIIVMIDDFITKTIFCEMFNALKTPNSNQYGYDGMITVNDHL